MLIPTYIVPEEDIELEDIKLTAGPRVNYSHFGGGSHTNSIEISDDTEKDILQKWLVFHSFVTNSTQPVDYYTREGLPDKLEQLKVPSQSPADFSQFISEIYYRDPEAAKKVKDKSYENLYNLYGALSAKKKALMMNYLIDLNRTDTRPDRQMLDTSYWQIVKCYALIDRIIGQPPFCKDALSCASCGAENLSHHKIRARQWTEDGLKEIMGDSKWYKTYSEVIGVTREKIRHVTVHSARLPSTSMPDHTDIDYMDYDLAKTLDGFQTDTYALKALKGMLESVTWYLLMDYLFNHKAFGRPTGYSVQYIRVHVDKGLLPNGSPGTDSV